MERLSWDEVISLAVKQKGKPAVYVSNGMEDNEKDTLVWEHILKCLEDTMPYFEIHMLLFDSLCFFDTEEEMHAFFTIFNTNPVYASCFYAASYSEDGECLNENT